MVFKHLSSKDFARVARVSWEFAAYVRNKRSVKRFLIIPPGAVPSRSESLYFLPSAMISCRTSSCMGKKPLQVWCCLRPNTW